MSKTKTKKRKIAFLCFNLVCLATVTTFLAIALVPYKTKTPKPIKLEQGLSSQDFIINEPIANQIPYSFSGGSGIYTNFSFYPALPSPIAFNKDTLCFEGTPNALSASKAYELTVTDSVGLTGSFSIHLSVDTPAITIGGPDSFEFIQNQPISDQTAITLSGGSGTYQLFGFTPTLPNNVTFNILTLKFEGKPTEELSNKHYTFSVTDSDEKVKTKSIYIEVLPAESMVINSDTAHALINVYDDTTNKVISQLDCIDVRQAAIDEQVDVHEFIIDGTVTYPIFIPADFHAIIHSGVVKPTQSLYDTTNNFAYGVIVGNKTSGQGPQSADISIEDTSIAVSSVNNVSCDGVYFATSCPTKSINISDSLIVTSSTGNGISKSIAFNSTIGGEVDINNNIITSSSFYACPGIAFNGTITSEDIDITNNLIHTSCSDPRDDRTYDTHAILFSDITDGDVLVEDNICQTRNQNAANGIRFCGVTNSDSTVTITSNVFSTWSRDFVNYSLRQTYTDGMQGQLIFTSNTLLARATGSSACGIDGFSPTNMPAPTSPDKLNAYYVSWNSPWPPSCFSTAAFTVTNYFSTGATPVKTQEFTTFSVTVGTFVTIGVFFPNKLFDGTDLNQRTPFINLLTEYSEEYRNEICNTAVTALLASFSA